MYPTELTDLEDWECISFNSLFSYEVRPVCQVMIVRREHGVAVMEVYQVYLVLPEWRVQILFSRHQNRQCMALPRTDRRLQCLFTRRDINGEKHGRLDRVASICRGSADDRSRRSWPSGARGPSGGSDMGEVEMEVAGQHLAKRAELEPDMCSG